MEQARRTRAHLERVLLVCGDQNAGKSRLLRFMLGDQRLGGNVPSSLRVAPRALSNERCLVVRLTSPHEVDQTTGEFHRRIDLATQTAWKSFSRINYACAVQPRPFKKMPGIADVCADLMREFRPERIRVVQLAPDQFDSTTSELSNIEVDQLRRLDVEVLSIDARRSLHPAEPGNVRVLADFFDFS